MEWKYYQISGNISLGKCDAVFKSFCDGVIQMSLDR